MSRFRNHRLFSLVLLGVSLSLTSNEVSASETNSPETGCLYSLDAANLPPSGLDLQWEIRNHGNTRIFSATLAEVEFVTTTFRACDHFSQVSTLVLGRVDYTEPNSPRFLTDDEIFKQIMRLAELTFAADDAKAIRVAMEGVDLVSIHEPILIDHDLYNMFEIALQRTPTLLIITISYAIS